MNPARAADAAEVAVRVALAERAALAQRYGDYLDRCGKAIAAQDRGLPAPPPGVPDSMTARLLGSAQVADAAYKWRQNRIVYTVDPGLAVELADTDPSGTIPARLVNRLPHPNPYLALPEPFTVPISGSDERARIVGAFVGALADGPTGVIVPTGDPAAEHLRLILPGIVEDARGRPLRNPDGTIAVTWSYLTMLGHEQTMTEMIEQVAARVRQGSSIDGLPRPGDLAAIAVRLFAPLITYLCAANADYRQAPAVATRRRADGSARPGKPPRVIEVGYHIGPQLAAARRAERAALATGTGGTVRPHVRRAHWHTYRVGPGRAEKVVHWLAPIAVHPDQEATKATVIRVPEPATLEAKQ